MTTSSPNIPVRLENGMIIYIESAVESSPIVTDVIPQSKEINASAINIPEFREITDTLESIAESISTALEKAKPRKATVEFGFQVAFESGKLTSLLVKGTGSANLKITLEWDRETTAESSSTKS